MQLTWNAQSRRLTANLTAPEAALLDRAIAKNGIEQVASLLAGYAQAEGQRVMDEERETIKAFADRSTPEERATVLAAMPKQGGR